MRFIKLGAALAAVATMGSAQATLYDRGGGLVYDDDLNITWLQDANYVKSSGYDLNGLMNWSAALDWANQLVYHDSVRNVEYSDWRLPTALNADGSGPCTGFYCRDSEMTHLFFIEGELGNGQFINQSSILKSYFIHMANWSYWTSTEYASDTDRAWEFYAGTGVHYLDLKTVEYYAWAVRDGDVTQASTVSAPPALLLMLTGLGLIVLTKRSPRYAN